MSREDGSEERHASLAGGEAPLMINVCFAEKYAWLAMVASPTKLPGCEASRQNPGALDDLGACRCKLQTGHQWSSAQYHVMRTSVLAGTSNESDASHTK